MKGQSDMTTKKFQEIIEREIEFHEKQADSHKMHILRLRALNAGLKAELGLSPFDNNQETDE
jgi:hypothetical protein